MKRSKCVRHRTLVIRLFFLALVGLPCALAEAETPSPSGIFSAELGTDWGSIFNGSDRSLWYGGANLRLTASSNNPFSVTTTVCPDDDVEDENLEDACFTRIRFDVGVELRKGWILLEEENPQDVHCPDSDLVGSYRGVGAFARLASETTLRDGGKGSIHVEAGLGRIRREFVYDSVALNRSAQRQSPKSLVTDWAPNLLVGWKGSLFGPLYMTQSIGAEAWVGAARRATYSLRVYTGLGVDI